MYTPELSDHERMEHAAHTVDYYIGRAAKAGIKDVSLQLRYAKTCVMDYQASATELASRLNAEMVERIVLAVTGK